MLSTIELAQLLTGALDERFNVSRIFHVKKKDGNLSMVEKIKAKMSQKKINGIK